MLFRFGWHASSIEKSDDYSESIVTRSQEASVRASLT
ncbi:hypothetical protein EMIT0P44_120119 [Pseudomonas sp. IT-P44]